MEKEKKTVVTREKLKTIVDQIEETSYGSVSVIIQDNRIVQIEKNEKIRFSKEKE